MRLLITAPTGVLADVAVRKIVAASLDGSYCLLPRHTDVTTLLVPGLLAYHDEEDREVFAALDHGVLVKAGDVVRVACQRGVIAGDLGEAEATVRKRFRVQSEREKRARSTLLRLEADILRRLGEMRGGS